MTITTALARAAELGLEITTDAFGRASESAAVRRSLARGAHVRVCPGVYAATETWRVMTSDRRFEAFVVGMATTMAPGTVFSHSSAAVLLGLPSLWPWPARVDTTIPPASGGRSTGNVRRFGAALRDDEIREVDGFLVTSPARTVLDIARVAPFAHAVATADAALHRKRRPAPLLTLDELAAELEFQRGRSRFAKMRRVAEFATPLSDSVRESESRVLIFELGFPEPVLQHPWFDALGHIGDSDFWWPEYGLVGEYDGLSKYLKEEFLGGRTTAQAVMAEKTREDRIRRLGPRFTRWDTPVLNSRPRFARQLLESGLPQLRPARYSNGRQRLA
ncbi:MAG TPA: hypothetical protein VGC45_09415 [Gryllotalpicola sp.]